MKWISENIDWIFSGVGIVLFGYIVTMIGKAYIKIKSKIKVKVHIANFVGDIAPQYFIKVINVSNTDQEITHIWFKTSPKKHILNEMRRLPYRLKPNETWETWINVRDVPLKIDEKNQFNLVRVMDSRGRIYKSQHNKTVPKTGYIAGSDQHL